MTILVDDCAWHWRGRRWCHMVSDASHDELHSFAQRLGVPSRAFQGDHYDIPQYMRIQAVVLGAHEVSSRELLVRLRGAGLRLSASERQLHKLAVTESTPSR